MRIQRTIYYLDYDEFHKYNDSQEVVVNGAFIVNTFLQIGSIELHCCFWTMINPIHVVNGYTPSFPLEMGYQTYEFPIISFTMYITL